MSKGSVVADIEAPVLLDVAGVDDASEYLVQADLVKLPFTNPILRMSG